MTSRFTGKKLKTNHLLIPELLHFLENLKFQPYVSNTPAALACSSINKTPMLYVFLFGHSMFIEIQVFSKILIHCTKYTCGKSEKRPAVPFDCS